MGEGCSWKRPSSFVADTMGETGSLVGGRLSCSSARLSVADNAGNARSGEPSCNVTRCDKGPPGIVDTVGTVCPETGFPVAVLGRAWRADGCSMAAPRFRLLRKSTETKECARISGDFAAHSVFIRTLIRTPCSLNETHLEIPPDCFQSGLRPKSDKLRQAVNQRRHHSRASSSYHGADVLLRVMPKSEPNSNVRSKFTASELSGHVLSAASIDSPAARSALEKI